MNTYKPMDASTLTYQERKSTLDLLIFITEKINRGIKSRKVFLLVASIEPATDMINAMVRLLH